MEFLNRVPFRVLQKLDKLLTPCPFCGSEVRIVQSDGDDCRISRECRRGYYIKCWKCDLFFGYEPKRGGVYDSEHLGALVARWNTLVQREEEE